MSKFKGIVDCTNAEYHGEREHLSSSNLKLLLKDTEQFYQEKILGNKPKQESKPHFDEGSYAHSLILEPEMVEHEYAFFPGFRKSGKDWDTFSTSNTDKIILSKPQKHRVEKWVQNYKELPAAVDLMKGTKPEFSLFTEFLDVKCKVRADAINLKQGYIVDVKTTAHNTDVDSFRYVVDSLGYGLSAAFYTKLFEEFYQMKFDFYWLVLGKRDDMCQVYKMSQKTYDSGYLEVLNALNTFKRCKEKNDWTNDTKTDIVDVTNYEILEI